MVRHSIVILMRVSLTTCVKFTGAKDAFSGGGLEVPVGAAPGGFAVEVGEE